MSTESISVARSILGYSLRERIGSGGYGEVWTAEAPGGILKAVKLVYGYHDEERAQNELKALNRIKDLRHPFLLSLERIDIIDGRLIVVTELADMSLKDRYEQCREKTGKGIPRDELLAYMRDAADALDYIGDSHSLQHLDIKPQNLLLVGGHVKIADFGLVKEIVDVQQSFMGGLTPTYAAPELFDGCPSRQSDQYSLAIVFQEMLTGKRPFQGSTVAQLATAHVNESPDITSLSRGDQQVIARALAKNPTHRYPNCKALVADLCGRTVGSSTKREYSKPTRSREESSLSPESDSDRLTATIRTTLLSHDFSGEIRKLGIVSCDPAQATFRPTLFIGIGRTATSSLRRLRKRLCDRLGGLDKIPSVRILCLDTDVGDLAEACRHKASHYLAFDETLAMPLRESKDYRAAASTHSTWLSRRWIYNVPRSRQTEGIRPLGRLAFVDHHERVLAKLHDLVEEMTRPEAIAGSSELVGLPPSSLPPRVFIVACVSGGVGSGSVLDMAYAVRAVLIEQGCGETEVNGLLLFSQGGKGSNKDIAIANSFACLNELYHFSFAEHYPGDESCRLPSFEDGGPTFSHTYLVDLGGDVLQDEYEQAVEGIAEYLYLNSVSRCSVFFDECRKQVVVNEGMTFRSFGLTDPVSISDDAVIFPAASLCRQIVADWQGTSGDADSRQELKSMVLAKLTDLQLSLENIANRINEIIKRRFGQSPESALLSVAQRFLAVDSTRNLSAEESAARLDEVIERSLTSGSTSEGRGFDAALRFSIDEFIANAAGEFGGPLSDLVLSQLDTPESRFKGANGIYEILCHGLRSLTETVQRVEEAARKELDTTRLNLFPAPNSTIPDPEAGKHDLVAAASSVDDEQLKKYIRLRLQIFALRKAKRTFQRIDAYLKERLAKPLERVVKALQRLSDVFQKQAQQAAYCGATSTTEQLEDLPKLIVKQVMARSGDLVRIADHRMTGDIVSGLCEADDRTSLTDVASAVLNAAISTVSDALKEVDFDQVINGAKFDGMRIADWTKRNLSLAMPTLLPKCGGDTRLLLAVPERSQPGIIAECLETQFDEKPTTIPATNGGVTICYEAEGVSLKNVLLRLVKDRPNCVEYVGRLHTRIDVEWTRITDLIS